MFKYKPVSILKQYLFLGKYYLLNCNTLKKINVFKNFNVDENENYYCHFREHSCEVLFEQDNEQQSISTIILDAIINVRIHIQC